MSCSCLSCLTRRKGSVASPRRLRGQPSWILSTFHPPLGTSNLPEVEEKSIQAYLFLSRILPSSLIPAFPYLFSDTSSFLRGPIAPVSNVRVSRGIHYSYFKGLVSPRLFSAFFQPFLSNQRLSLDVYPSQHILRQGKAPFFYHTEERDQSCLDAVF